MSFTSITFLWFAPIVILVYYLILPNWRIPYLTLVSLAFYGYWDYHFLPLLFGSAIIDYICAIKINQNKNVNLRRRWLICSIVLNLGILIFFKLNSANSQPVPTDLSNLVIPLGLSFYTLQTMSYTFDVYRGKTLPQQNFVTFFLFVSFFPQLVSGPIERASNLLPQLQAPKRPSMPQVRYGIMLIAWGLFIKLVVSNNLAPFVSTVFQGESSGLILWPLAFVAMAQVYCDFHGYTEIARGLAMLLGVRLSENFKQPYMAADIVGFWQRWHITLTRWVMDYVTMPLLRQVRLPIFKAGAIFLSFLLIGLWHDFTWGFFLFGLTQAAAILIWNFVSKKGGVIGKNKLIKSIISRLYMVLILSISAPMFYISDANLMFNQLWNMFDLFNSSNQVSVSLSVRFDFYIGMVFFCIVMLNDLAVFRQWRFTITNAAEFPLLRKVSLLFLIVSIIFLGNFNTNTFVYFQF